LKRKGNKTTNKEENKNKGDLKKQKQRRLEKKNSFFMILQEGEEKKQKKSQSSVFSPNKGEEHRAALSSHSFGVAQHQDDRVPPEEHLGDEPVPRDPRPPRARSLRRGPPAFGASVHISLTFSRTMLQWRSKAWGAGERGSFFFRKGGRRRFEW